MRGPGNIFGSMQSGLRFTGLRAADFVEHTDLLKDAHAMATAIYKNNYPYLVGDREIQDLLTLFRAPSSTPTVSPRDLTPPELRSAIKSASKTAEATNLPGTVDLTITEGPYAPVVIVFDLETTGLSPLKEHIIQFAAQVVETSKSADESPCVELIGRARNRKFNQYVKPKKVKVSRQITVLTGITQEDLDTKGKPFSEVWLEFLEWLQEVSESDETAISTGGATRRPIVLVSHNLKRFDMPFLDAEIRRNDLNTRGDWISSANISTFVDSLNLLKSKDLWSERKVGLNLAPDAASQPENQKLGTVYEFIHGRKIVNAHDASSDTDALEEILQSEGLREIWRKHAFNLQSLSFNRCEL